MHKHNQVIIRTLLHLMLILTLSQDIHIVLLCMFHTSIAAMYPNGDKTDKIQNTLNILTIIWGNVFLGVNELLTSNIKVSKKNHFHIFFYLPV